MSLVILIVILLWSVFWLAYSLYIFNTERLYYRPNKVFTRRQRPFLFYAEVTISFLWSILGFVMLYVFLRQSI